MAGCDGGGPVTIGPVAVVTCALPSSPTNATEKTLDLLNGFAQDCLAQQNVDPRIQDGIYRSYTDSLQIWVLLDVSYYIWTVQLIHKDPDLEKKGIHV